MNEKYLINDFDFSSDRFFSKNGFVSNFNLLFKNVSKEGRNSDEYGDDFENKNFISSNYTINFPLKKDAIFEKSFIPKLSLRYSPFNNEDIKDLDRQINTTNLFSNNRLGLSTL